MSNDAETSLRELEALAGRTRLASRSMATGFPMVGWGTAWILGFGAVDLLEGSLRIVVAALAWTIGMLLSWLPIRAVIRTGSRTRMRWAWLVVLLSTPFLVAAARPATLAHALLLLGAVWGLAMCLYAVATDDRVLVAAAGFGIVVAGLLPFTDIADPVLWFGVGAGLPLLVLGTSRVLRGRV